MIARRNFNQNPRYNPNIRNVRGPMPRSMAPRSIGTILSLVLDKYGVDAQTAKLQTVVVPAARPAVQQRFQF